MLGVENYLFDQKDTIDARGKFAIAQETSDGHRGKGSTVINPKSVHVAVAD